MKRDKIELDVIVNNSPIKEYGNKGDCYIEGRLGTEYKLRVRNHYGHRVLVVPSIDGLNPLNGKTTENNDEGYVVAAYGSITIDGWRTSLSQVNKFVFNKKTQSYTAKSGNGTANCGVIGVQVFGEKIPEVQYYPVYYPQPVYVYPKRYDYYQPTWIAPTYFGDPIITCNSLVGGNSLGNDSCNFTSSLGNTIQSTSLRSSNVTSNFQASNLDMGNLQAASQSMDNSLSSMGGPCSFSIGGGDEPHQLGTGWGETKESLVTQVSFVKGALLQTLEIFYADRRGLESLGVDLSKASKVCFQRPQAFSNFCKAPTN